MADKRTVGIRERCAVCDAFHAERADYRRKESAARGTCADSALAVENAGRLGRDSRDARQRVELDCGGASARPEEPRDRAGHAQRGRDERNAERAATWKPDVRGALPIFLSR